jgi:hypothetical protein
VNLKHHFIAEAHLISPQKGEGTRADVQPRQTPLAPTRIYLPVGRIKEASVLD